MKKFATLGLTLGLLAGGAGVAGASTISWTGAPLIGTGTTTISTAGFLVEAHNVGDSSAAPIAAGSVSFDELAANPFGNENTGFVLPYTPVFTGNAAFDVVLDSASWWWVVPVDLTLTGLTPGDSYLAQFFVADTRECCIARTVIVSAGNSSESGALSAGWVFTGTFVADATTQTVTFSGTGPVGINGAPYLNASQLRNITATDRGIDAVPEPATLVLCGIGAMLAASRLRRRQ